MYTKDLKPQKRKKKKVIKEKMKSFFQVPTKTKTKFQALNT